MELRQLRYFVTLAEELHFGRAAAREHIVQSALSQQLQRLERELGVLLIERTTHHVRLNAAGAAFLIEARQILAHVERAAVAAQRAARSTPSLRVGIVDASYDSMPLILHEVQQRYPDLEIHQVEAGVPEQFQRLVDGRLDVGLGRASLAPPSVASELFRLDPLGVLVAEEHRFAGLPDVPVATLAAEPLLFAEEERAPEFNQFVIELCRSVGFIPDPVPGDRRQHPGLGRPRRAAALRAVRTVLLRTAGGPGWCGGRWWLPRRATRGRCCGGPVTPPSTSTPSSSAPARCPGGSAGWNRGLRWRAKRDPEGDHERVIGDGDESFSDPSFPAAAKRGSLSNASGSGHGADGSRPARLRCSVPTYVDYRAMSPTTIAQWDTAPAWRIHDRNS